VIQNQIGETMARYLCAVLNSCSLELQTKACNKLFETISFPRQYVIVDRTYPKILSAVIIQTYCR